MEEKQMIVDENNHLSNKQIWYNTKDPDFIRLSLDSMVAQAWLSYPKGVEDGYEDSIIKPLNNYVRNISEPPSLVSIVDNTVRLRFRLYADMYLLEADGEDFYHVDRPWMRQYYNTEHVIEDREDCFAGTFKFFVPWFIDDNLEVEYLQPTEESPFYVKESKDFWYKIPEDAIFLQPHFVFFKFKRHGKHMVDNELGIPRRGDPMFDMQFRGDDIIIERVREFYANH